MNSNHYLGFGTNTYPNLGSSATLNKCESDVQELAKTVESCLGFSQEIFIGNQTTKANIVKTILSRLISLENLADETKKTSFLIIHKSSHGSQQPDKNGDEPDHADECWVCYDTAWNVKDDCWDNAIVDDELVTILNGVNPKKCLVMVVSDTCNSGTFTRELKPHVIQERRFVFPRNNKLYKINKLADKVKNGRKKRSIENQYFVEIPEINWLLFAGANDNTFSYETAAGGILTSTIVDYIRNHRKDLGSVSSASLEIAKEVRAKNSQQYAHIECPSWFLNKKFFGTEDCPTVAKTTNESFWKKLWNLIVFWR